MPLPARLISVRYLENEPPVRIHVATKRIMQRQGTWRDFLRMYPSLKVFDGKGNELPPATVSR